MTKRVPRAAAGRALWTASILPQQRARAPDALAAPRFGRERRRPLGSLLFRSVSPVKDAPPARRRRRSSILDRGKASELFASKRSTARRVGGKRATRSPWPRSFGRVDAGGARLSCAGRVRRARSPANPRGIARADKKGGRSRPFRSFAGKRSDQKSMPPMPPPPPPIGIAGFSFGTSATIASVVMRSPATEAASCSAVRTTLAGSTMPASIMST